MEAEYPERKNRIKLRVLTSTGLNLLCTANRSQKIKELLPHIIKLYEEVKEDQGLNDLQNQVSKPFIKFIRKEEFLIAPSELVADIFDDNDEVFCEIADEAILNPDLKIAKKEKETKQEPATKTESKPSKTKKIKKKNSKEQIETKDNNNPEKLVSKEEISQEREQLSTEKVRVESENNKEVKDQKPAENKQNAPANAPKENKKKKNKISNNKPKENESEQKDEKKEVISKPEESEKSNVKKTQVSEQKSSGTPLLSTDELAKFRQMMKKSTNQ